MRLCLTALASVVLAAVAFAADWPQWRGPDRNEISKETGIRTEFSASPKPVWSCHKAGSGYSGPAVVGKVLYCLGAEDEEFAFALNTEDGQEIWRVTLGPRFKNGYGDGPRCTPTVDGDRLYIIRGDGDLHCLSAKDGKELWKKNFRKDFGGQIMSGWGYSESPLVDGEKLLCTPGGGNGSIIALNKMTGETIWRCTDLNDAATYSSIIAADAFGVHQYIQMLKDGVAGVKADDGKRLWYYERGVRTAGIPTPIYSNGYVYSTAGYNVGCDLIKLTASDGNFSAEKVYHDNLSNHHGGVVLLDGYIYGYFDGHGWVCQEFTTGKVKWEAKGTGKPGKGSLTYADGHLFCYDERSGTCHVVEASPKGYKETGQIKLPKKSEIRSGRGGIWTHPVIANGKLYLRDQDLLFCFDIKK